jgi:hypothetical protein
MATANQPNPRQVLGNQFDETVKYSLAAGFSQTQPESWTTSPSAK